MLEWIVFKKKKGPESGGREVERQRESGHSS